MRFAEITGILRLLLVPSMGSGGGIAKISVTTILAAAALSAAPAAPATDSPEYDAVIIRALTLPVKDALRTLDSLSRVQGVPGWVRAKSLKLLGDHQFIKSDYKKSADFYQQASKFDNSSLYRHLYALALAADGQTAQANEIWSAISEDPSDPMIGEASSLLQQTMTTSGPPVPFTPPPAPPLVSAQGTRIDDKAVAPISQPAAKDGSKSVLTIEVQQATNSNSQNIGTLYTVQVGAFGSKENAENLFKKLSGTYKDITISPTTSGEQTLYRVRIGTFENREDAAAFADKLITTAGLSARVFEK